MFGINTLQGELSYQERKCAITSLWIIGNGLDCGSGDSGSIPSEANLPRVGTPLVKGLLTSVDVLGASVGVGLACLGFLATHDFISSQQVQIWKLDFCPLTEQAEMSLNVTLNHNTTKF